jgi:hypothetical protein
MDLNLIHMSSLLHAITAAFHEVKDYRRRNRVDHEKAVHDQQVLEANR